MTISSSSINWRTIMDTRRSARSPDDEWWYSLDPKENDGTRTVSIRRSMTRYEERFGCPPAELPRVVMVGKTPMLAYAIPVKQPVRPPMTVIIEEPTESIMQLMLL